MVYLFLAEGFEEIEALTPVDILRRGGVEVTTVGVTGKTVKGSHGITVVCDREMDECDFSDLEMLVLPGGMPGTLHLSQSEKLCELIQKTAEQKRILAAICAAPTVFGKLGLLKNRPYTCYPGCETGMDGRYTGADCEVFREDFLLITANGPGAAARFSFRLLEALRSGSEKAIRLAMQY